MKKKSVHQHPKQMPHALRSPCAGKEAGAGKGVLALYDLRGIQKFIFHTNAVKEIIGGSEIVRTLLEDALCAFTKTRGGERHQLEWFQDGKACPFRFLDDGTISSEVLYCGGGNLLVAWRSPELAREAGRFMHRYILEHAYSLTLSYATALITDSYQEDYRRLCASLDRVKSLGYRALPVMGCPFSVPEQGTGLPAVVRCEDDSRISRETQLKRRAYERITKSKHYCFEIDDITKGKEKNFVAVVHIDGNSMGMCIRERLETCPDYRTAVCEMRKLSNRISRSFTDTLDAVVDSYAQTNGDGKLALRPIICAGDDITIICRADIAMQLVQSFILRIEKQAMCDGADGKPDLEHYAFSACAGIAFVRTHFPFYTAYELCEQLCSQAKTKAKLPENLVSGQVGSYLDFHIVGGAVLDDIEELREREYVNAQGYSLLQRPLLCAAESGRTDSVPGFRKQIEDFGAVPRSWLKRIRNAYCLNESMVNSVLLQSSVNQEQIARLIKQHGEHMAFDEQHRARYFDALELMDMLGEGRKTP